LWWRDRWVRVRGLEDEVRRWRLVVEVRVRCVSVPKTEER
jgi:hypothetical protein